MKLLTDNGYDPTSPSSTVISDTDAPLLLGQGAQLLQQAGRAADATNALRVAAVAANVRSAHALDGVGRALWASDGTSAPASLALAAAEASAATSTQPSGLTAMRYVNAYALDPSMVTAPNNLGVWYAQNGKTDLASFYLKAANFASPQYALGGHNLAALEYGRGLGNFFTAESGQAAAIKSVGPQSLSWGYNLRSDDRGPFPAPATPSGSNSLGLLTVVIIIALLLLHTLVGKDRLTNRMGVRPTRGILGTIAGPVDAEVKKLVPGLVQPRKDLSGLLLVVGIPSLIGMLALAWAAGHGSIQVALIYLPVALLVSLLAFGANEFAQYFAARRNSGTSLHHIWPLGSVLGILSIPFGFVYGWQVITRVQPASGDTSEDAPSARRNVATRRARTGEELDMAYEAQIEAAADLDTVDTQGKTAAPVSAPSARSRLFALSPSARIFFAGLAANLVIGLIFGIAYWVTAWPSLRLGLFASMLVLAFNAVSEPPADGWTLYRRNSPVWLVLFIFASAIVVMLASSII